MDTAWTSGFILMQEWADLPGGCLLTFWGTSETGPFEVRVPTRPVLFIPRLCSLPPDVRPAERRQVEMRDFSGTPVDALYFLHQRELRQARSRLAAAGVPTLEDDLSPAARFLMERFIHGACEVGGSGSVQDGVTVFQNGRLRPGSYEPSLSLLSFDIETGSSGQLYAIGFRFERGDSTVRRVYAAGHGHHRKEPPLFFCGDEASLLQRFLDDVRDLDPDLLAGWNIIGFDLPFLAGKCREWGVPFALGRRGLEARLTETGGRWAIDVPGRVVADGIPLLRATGRHFDDYRLETVARQLLGEGKTLSFEGADKQAEIDRLFATDVHALAAYNLADAELVCRIFAAADISALIVSRSRISGMLPDRLGRSIAAFDHFYLPRLHRKGYVAPGHEIEEPTEPLPGGLILPSRPGCYRHVVVLDFKSLYPSVIRTFHICPYAGVMADRAPVTTPTGARFSGTEHILPDYIGELMAVRAKARADGNAALSQAVKILMNSFYGILGSTNSRFFDPVIATAITGTGQWILRTARDRIEQGGRPVLYGDTDSLFVQVHESEAAAPWAAAGQLVADINAFFAAELHVRFGVTSALEIEFEHYYRRFYLPAARHSRAADPGEEGEGAAEGAAKRYAGQMVHADGREELHVIGMESVRSDWTPLAHRIQREALERFFRDQPLKTWLREQVARLRAGTCDSELVYRRRLRKPPSSYTHAMPPHVRAAKLLPASQQRSLGAVEYVMTLRGPVPVALPHDDYDYGHYLERQVRPVVEDLLALGGTDFDSAVSGEEQLRLF